MIRVLSRDAASLLHATLQNIAAGMFSDQPSNGYHLIQYVLDGCKAKTAILRGIKEV